MPEQSAEDDSSRHRFAITLLAPFRRCSLVKEFTCKSSNKFSELNLIENGTEIRYTDFPVFL